MVSCSFSIILNFPLTLTLRQAVYWFCTEGGTAMKTVKQVSKLSGVSIRTLHHYEEL